jgi:hypothetical protein
MQYLVGAIIAVYIAIRLNMLAKRLGIHSVLLLQVF